MAQRKKRKQLSGGAKMKAAGKKAILLGVSPEQHAKLKQAATIELRPISQFVLFYAIQAADKSIAKNITS